MALDYLIFHYLDCSDEHGDRPRPLPVVEEVKEAFDITKREEAPSWGFDVSIYTTSISLFASIFEKFSPLQPHCRVLRNINVLTVCKKRLGNEVVGRHAKTDRRLATGFVQHF